MYVFLGDHCNSSRALWVNKLLCCCIDFAGSIHVQPKDTVRERKLYDKLKALNKYHKRNGIEAILYKKFKEKRQRSRDGTLHGPPKPSFQTRCIFTEGGVKCGERIIPCSKYCRKHILEDKKQVMFRACDVEKGGVVCQEPVTNIFEDATCALHIQLPAQRSYSLKKNESESEDETELSKATKAADGASTSQLFEIKKEEPVSHEYVAKALPIPVEIQPLHSIDNLKLEELDELEETNLTICHDTSSATLIVVPKSSEAENAQNAEMIKVIETNTIATNEQISIADNPQSMEVDDKWSIYTIFVNVISKVFLINKK